MLFRSSPLGFQLLLTWVSYLPASTATSSMLWHFVEHVPCTARARTECAFGTHVHRADTLAPTVLAHTAEPRHALPFSPLRAKPPLATPGKPRASRRRRPTASAHVGAAKATSARQLADMGRGCQAAAAASSWLAGRGEGRLGA